MVSCMFMGSCRWAIKRVVTLQIFPSFYLLIHENPQRWTHKAAAGWLRARGEGGYVVPSLSGCAPFSEGCEGKALLVLLPSCSFWDHLSPTHLDTQGWTDGPGCLCVSGTEFHHVAWSFSTILQIPVTFEKAWEWDRGTSSSSALRTGRVWTNIIFIPL